MTDAVPGILARIVTHKREELARAVTSREEWERRAADNLKHRRDFRAALLHKCPAIIAEIKKASPSKGLLCENFDPPALAKDYEAGGAAALSVLTDEKFFQGGLTDLCAARAAVSIPVLRKDFILDSYQVVEAAAHNADAILLIAAVLPLNLLRRLREEAARYQMAALASGAEIVGVNNRDLRSFDVTLETSLRLAERIPAGIVKVSESGIRSSEDVRRLSAAGFDAFLVGEHLVRSPDRARALRALVE